MTLHPPLVTEHENAHYWPNGAYDGPEDEDCVWCSVLMQYLAANPGAAPATLYEAERCREAAGLGPSGPSSTADAIRGFTARHGWAPRAVVGFTALWAALQAGQSVSASGHPTDAPAGSPFRHWLPNYAGGHRVCLLPVDADTAWILDPEAPVGYAGEPVSKADVAAFTRLGSTHSAASIAQGDDMLAVETRVPLAAPNPRTFTIPPNTVVDGYDPAQPDKVVATFGPSPDASSAAADATASVDWPGTVPHPAPGGGGFLHVVNGALADLLIVAALVSLDPADPGAAGFTQADLDVAKGKGYEEGVNWALDRIRNPHNPEQPR